MSTLVMERQMMNRGIVIGLACLALALGGCATTFATRDDASSNSGSASPAPTSGPTNFASDHPPSLNTIEAP